MSAAPRAQLSEHLLGRHTAGRLQHLGVALGRGEDAGAERDRLAHQAARESEAVPPLVMRANQRRNLGRPGNERGHLRAQRWMRELRRERRLGGGRQQAGVVYQRGVRDEVAELLVRTQIGRNRAGGARNQPVMTLRRRRARVERLTESAQRVDVTISCRARGVGALEHQCRLFDEGLEQRGAVGGELAVVVGDQAEHELRFLGTGGAADGK